MLAVIPKISRLRALLNFVGKILMLALPCDDKHAVFRQTMCSFFEERKS